MNKRNLVLALLSISTFVYASGASTAESGASSAVPTVSGWSMPFEPGAKAAQPGSGRRSHDLNALRVDANGRYDVLLSPNRPADYKGDCERVVRARRAAYQQRPLW